MSEEAGQSVIQGRVLGKVNLWAERLALVLATAELGPQGRSRPRECRVPDLRVQMGRLPCCDGQIPAVDCELGDLLVDWEAPGHLAHAGHRGGAAQVAGGAPRLDQTGGTRPVGVDVVAFEGVPRGGPVR